MIEKLNNIINIVALRQKIYILLSIHKAFINNDHISSLKKFP